MACYLDLFSPETYQRFSRTDRTITGVRERHRSVAETLRSGDILVAYVTRISRWVGLLRVESTVFEDATPRFTEAEDPYKLRFHVSPQVWLPLEQGIPIHHDSVWKRLSITRDHKKGSSTWTGFFRSTLNQFADADGAVLVSMITEQVQARRDFPLTDQERRVLTPRVVRHVQGPVSVTVPEDGGGSTAEPAPKDVRDSIKVQALLAKIGSAMGLKIWLPSNDRAAVLREWEDETSSLVDSLPLNYDETTLDTIERIDVLWLRHRSIVRAFEVEHTTAIYSGLLRMADLLSLQPNMDIKLHIVAPHERRAKVFEELRRPVFSLLDPRPLAESCTFLSYDSVREIAELRHLSHVSDSILDEYQEEAE